MLRYNPIQFWPTWKRMLEEYITSNWQNFMIKLMHDKTFHDKTYTSGFQFNFTKEYSTFCKLNLTFGKANFTPSFCILAISKTLKK